MRGLQVAARAWAFRTRGGAAAGTRGFAVHERSENLGKEYEKVIEGERFGLTKEEQGKQQKLSLSAAVDFNVSPSSKKAATPAAGSKALSHLDETDNSGRDAGVEGSQGNRHDFGPTAPPKGPPDQEAMNMGTGGGAISPPPGQSFGDGSFAPASEGDNPSAMPDRSSPDTGFHDPHRDGAAEASTMATGAAMNPPPGSSFDSTGSAVSAAGEKVKGAAGEASEKVKSYAGEAAQKAKGAAEELDAGGAAEKVKGAAKEAGEKLEESSGGIVGTVAKAAKNLLHGTGKDPAAKKRGFASVAFFGSNAAPSPHGKAAEGVGLESGPMPGPGENAADPVYIGRVSDTLTGPNVLGGTPMKDPSQRQTSGSKLQLDTESMSPITPNQTTRPGIEHSGTGNRYFSSWVRAFSVTRSSDKDKAAPNEEPEGTHEEGPKPKGYDASKAKDADYERSSDTHPAQDMPGGTGSPGGLGVLPEGAKRVGNPSTAADADGSKGERLGS